MEEKYLKNDEINQVSCEIFKEEITKIPNIKVECKICKQSFKILKNFEKETVHVFNNWEVIKKSKDFLIWNTPEIDKKIFTVVDLIYTICPKCGHKEEFGCIVNKNKIIYTYEKIYCCHI